MLFQNSQHASDRGRRNSYANNADLYVSIADRTGGTTIHLIDVRKFLYTHFCLLIGLLPLPVSRPNLAIFAG